MTFMSNNQLNNRRPTALEEQAYAEAKQHFAKHLKQFPACLEAIQRLEQNVSALAAEMLKHAGSPRLASDNRIQTGDGEQWQKGLDLMNNCFVCYRSTGNGTEFATVEQLPSIQTNDILTKGHDAVEVLRAFARGQ